MSNKKKQPVYTPMITQYLEIKAANPGVLIMFRLGDFYEFFFEDAELVSKELQLVLTKKAAGNNQKIPMCGIPHHASTNYLAKLVDAGYKVGIVEQLEDASEAKGIVRRDIVQIVTPGSIVDFAATDHNYIVAIDQQITGYVVSYADVSTGDLHVTTLPIDETNLVNFLKGILTKEIVVKSTFSSKLLALIKSNLDILVSFENDLVDREQYAELIEDIKEEDEQVAVLRLLSYLFKTKKRQLTYLKKAEVAKTKSFLQIDNFSRLNLELTRTMRSDAKYGSLYWILDETTTAMGRRKLKDFIERPSYDLDEILRRQEIVNVFIVNYLTREEVKKHFNSIYDLERIVARIAFGNANPRDLLRLKNSLIALEEARALISKINNKHVEVLYKKLGNAKEIIKLIDASISEEAPLQISGGEIFKYNYNAELDQLIDLSHGGKKWISDLEEKERERTGIRTLKIGYNRVFGYYIEISNSYLDQVKDEFGYIRKQTMKSGERYINEELKEQEKLILSAEERRHQLEKQLFLDLLETLQKRTREIQMMAAIISEFDVYLSLATVAVKYKYVKPTFNNERKIEIINSRHPVLDELLKKEGFVENDIKIDETTDVLIITGPNMGGKSTLMRQLALIVIMAQLGSYVPAQSANLMLFDQIFTRIGASDDLISGQSTFMVEMNEANFALRRATNNSLLIFDEIGRGTSTYDGMALAHAIIDYVAQTLKVKTLFSTHYHEITAISENHPNIKNIHVEVLEKENEITFLYKIGKGPMNRSYGINVARLAGLPTSILNEAQKQLHKLVVQELPNQEVIMLDPIKPHWFSELEALDINKMSPLEALIFLQKIKDEGFE